MPTAERPAQKDASSSAKQPTTAFRFGQLSAAIFTNQVKLKSGKTANVPSITLRRSYRNTEGNWEHTHSLRVQDLLPAAQFLTRCFEYCSETIAEADGNTDERE